MENINVKKEYEEYIQNKLKKDGENNESEEFSVTVSATEDTAVTGKLDPRER